MRNTASGMTLPAGQSQSVFFIKPDGVDSAAYRRLDNEARFKMEAEGCYCSVLDECWVTDFNSRPKSVKTCEAIPDSQRW